MDSNINSIGRAPTLEEDRNRWLPEIKKLRQDIDALIQKVSPVPYNQERTGKEIEPNDFRTREIRNQVQVKLTEAKMWAGKMLESLGSPFPAELADKATK